jgi:5-methyltetrahydropteroyltriglutamate--homocysteine methyltransferase
MVTAANLGYPRIGKRRELKRALEAYWSGKDSLSSLRQVAAGLRKERWLAQHDAGLDFVPCGDFSLYDHVLDTVALVGAVPPRFAWNGGPVDLDTYFAMARGTSHGEGVAALALTKWFDTNYHYLVPEFSAGQTFQLADTKPFDELAEAQDCGVPARPVLLGPLSFLLLGRSTQAGFSPLDGLLDALLPVYAEVVRRLAAQGARWIQIDEPCLVQERSRDDLDALRTAYTTLHAAAGECKLLLQTYFGHVGEAFETLADLPVDAIGLDLVRGAHNLKLLAEHGYPAGKQLAVGVVDGRNVWRADLDRALETLSQVQGVVPADRLIVQPSCSLLHVPISVELEPLPAEGPDPRPWLAFADQKVGEVVTLTRALREGPDAVRDALESSREAVRSRRESPHTLDPRVRERLATVSVEDRRRPQAFRERKQTQQRQLGISDMLLPTTTIGSFPQTQDLRKARRLLRDGQLSASDYDGAVEDATREVIRLQEELGLDVLVHGEFERGDMVEYFAERLSGFHFTQHAWVQSYGSRYVRPPILYGDVSRPEPMTVRWSTFAQSLTERPVKGMLTGPVTLLNWSFVRDDQPRADTCRQLAMAVRDEVRDLEAAGLRVIQVDEPALREGLPQRRSEWPSYLEWAVESFQLSTAVAAAATQVQTHMCYSDFNDAAIFDSIEAMDADVLLIEFSRSAGELLEVFRQRGYQRDIGPGVYDVHSPAVPEVGDIGSRLRAVLESLRADQIWVNPDCGLKTRGWAEVTPSLRNMVQAKEGTIGSLQAAPH